LAARVVSCKVKLLQKCLSHGQLIAANHCHITYGVLLEYNFLRTARSAYVKQQTLNLS